MINEPEPIKVLLAGGDSFHARGLSTSLQQYGYAIAGIAGHAAEASRLFKDNGADIILINIPIPGDRDGVDIYFELMKTKRVPVVYLTAVAGATIIGRIKQTCPVAFLTKPYNISDVCVAIDMAMHNFMACGDIEEENPPAPGTSKRSGHDVIDNETILRQDGYIFVKRNFQFVKISLSEILYMEADGNYVHIIIKDKKFTIRLSLLQVIEKINYSRFVRINRSSVVNIDAIQSFNKEQVVIGQYEISIGKNYKESFFRQLGFR